MWGEGLGLVGSEGLFRRSSLEGVVREKKVRWMIHGCDGCRDRLIQGCGMADIADDIIQDIISPVIQEFASMLGENSPFWPQQESYLLMFLWVQA